MFYAIMAAAAKRDKQPAQNVTKAAKKGCHCYMAAFKII
jgi:hypothetical protein